MKEINFVQVGEMIECGHCYPGKHVVYPDMACSCICHRNEMPVDDRDKLIQKTPE